MKVFLHIGFMLALVMGASAQGPFQLTATLQPIEPLPPFPIIFGGQGQFTLEGTTLRYQVSAGFYATDWSCQIRNGGPGGAVLFDLPLSGCSTPIGTNLGSCYFRGI